MNTVNFFTAVTYVEHKPTFAMRLEEKIDSYFYLGGRKAHIIQANNQHKLSQAYLSCEENIPILEKLAKIISFCTIVVPVILLALKATFRYSHKICLLDPQAELEKGLNVPKETIDKINDLIHIILSKETHREITWYPSRRLVFQLNGCDEWIFKCVPGTYERFQNMIRAQAVCMVEKLHNLVIPHAHLIKISTPFGDMFFIAEQKLNFLPLEESQESLWRQQASSLNDTVRQLAIFVAKTGFHDVDRRNIPILSDNQGRTPRIGLIDLEDMQVGQADQGILGGYTNNSIGLIRCANSKEQIDTIVDEVQKKGVVLNTYALKYTINERLYQLELDKELDLFYQERKIKNGAELIPLISWERLIAASARIQAKQKNVMLSAINDMIQSATNDSTKKDLPIKYKRQFSVVVHDQIEKSKNRTEVLQHIFRSLVQDNFLFKSTDYSRLDLCQA